MPPSEPVAWLPERRFEAYGVRFRVRTNSESLVPLIDRCLPYGAKPVSGDGARSGRLFSLHLQPDGTAAAYGGTRSGVPTSDLAFALQVLESNIELHVARNTAAAVFVHAGAVAYGGAGIIIPGPGFSGKSSLVLALVRAGATYFSDEYAVFDRKGMLHPYARPPHTRDGPGNDRTMHPLETLGSVGSGPVPVGLVVSTTYEPGAAWEPRTMPPAETVLALFAHAIPARRRPAATLDALRLAVDGARGLEGTRGNATDVARLLLDALEVKSAR